jgi:DNA-binding transcriptional LysR family regulator
VELRHLRHFVAVAEELHFGHAAKRLKIAQPPLSQSIMRLEDSLGARLLDRSSRRIQLTTAGHALLPEARDILARAALAQRIVQRLSAGELGKLRIGFVPMSATITLPRAIQSFRKAWPGVEVQLQERTSSAQVEALRSGALDLGIIVREIVDTSGLEILPFERYGYVAAVPSNWPLGSRSSLRLADLASSPLILFPQQLAGNFFKEFETAHLKIEGVSYVTIRDMPDVLCHDVALAWVPRSVPRILRDMITLIKKRASLSERPAMPRLISR